MELNNTERLSTYIIMAGIFMSSMTVLNILGTSKRFMNLSFNIFGFNFPLIVAIGVLPYPITFLCTDLISGIFVKKLTIIVWTGLVVNLWLGLILWLGGIAPEFHNLYRKHGNK